MEQRLYDYLKERKYQKQNDILPFTSLEEEYKITKKDIETIKTYLKHIKYRKQSFENDYELKHERSELHYEHPTRRKQFRIEDKKYKNHCPEMSINKLIGSLETYSKDSIPDLSEVSEMDKDNKIVIPNISNNKKNIDVSEYKAVPYIGRGCGNIDVENDIMCGLPTRLYSEKYKSLGYENPEEHYYQYIDERVQHPDSVVLPFPRGGESTRLDKKCSRKKEKARDFFI